MSKTLQDLARTHLAVLEMLESKLISLQTRRTLEKLREELENDLRELMYDSEEDAIAS